MLDQGSQFRSRGGTNAEPRLVLQQQMQEGYQLAKNAEDGAPVRLAEPIDAAAGVLKAQGNCQRGLLLPTGQTIGENVGLGLPEIPSLPQIHSFQFDKQLNGCWVEFSAVNQSRVRCHSFVLFSNDPAHSGYDARLRVYSPLQFELFSRYREAAAAAGALITPAEPIDAASGIFPDGPLKASFLLPCGREIGAVVAVGLPQPSSAKRLHSFQHDKERNGCWVEISANNLSGVRRHFFVLLSADPDLTGREAVLHSLSPQQHVFFELYQKATSAERPGDPVEIDTDISPILGARNHGKVSSCCLPNGQSPDRTFKVGLPEKASISSYTAISIAHLGDDRFILWTKATLKSEIELKIPLFISNAGIAVGGKVENGVLSAKGAALDRYVAHLAAVADLRDLRSEPRLACLPLTGERFAPNLVASQTVIHTKWGEYPDRVLSYMLRYLRMLQVLGVQDGAPDIGCFLVASDSHLKQLQNVLRKACSELGLVAGLSTVESWGRAVLKEKVSESIPKELRHLEALAAFGFTEELKSRKYIPMPAPAGAQEPMLPTVAWQDRMDTFLQPEGFEALIQALATQGKIHALYWERSYHFDLIKCCSYVLWKLEQDA